MHIGKKINLTFLWIIWSISFIFFISQSLKNNSYSVYISNLNDLSNTLDLLTLFEQIIALLINIQTLKYVIKYWYLCFKMKNIWISKCQIYLSNITFYMFQTIGWWQEGINSSWIWNSMSNTQCLFRHNSLGLPTVAIQKLLPWRI